jgi:3-oxoacyl-[acyl-carrier-protein] synthase II
MKMFRVAVTGMGALCGLGNNLGEIWRNAIEGKSGISKISNADVTNMPVDFAGEIKNFKIAEELLSARESDRYDIFVHYALHAAHEACQQAGIWGQLPYEKNRVGCIMGVGMGGFPMIERQHTDFLQKGYKRVTPFFIPGIIPNMTSGIISMKLQAMGTNYSISSACASSTHAMGAAFMEIAVGRHDMVVTGGAEAVITAMPLAGFTNMKALSRKGEAPEKASRPFDKDRDGFVVGEGAGILVFENYEKALARGAKILGEIVGFGASSDAYHITAPHPEGAGAILCMKNALESTGLSPEVIGHINAHGTATPLGDIAETKAIKKIFGAHAQKILINSTKSMTGHLLGAAGGIEAIFSLMAMNEGVIPPTINLDNPDPECDLNYCANRAVKADIEYALSNSFGFGGTNASVVFRKYS